MALVRVVEADSASFVALSVAVEQTPCSSLCAGVKQHRERWCLGLWVCCCCAGLLAAPQHSSLELHVTTLLAQGGPWEKHVRHS